MASWFSVSCWRCDCFNEAGGVLDGFHQAGMAVYERMALALTFRQTGCL